MKQINFKQIFGNELIGGHICVYDGDDFDENAFDSPLEFPEGDVWYENLHNGTESISIPNVSDSFKEAIGYNDITLVEIGREHTDEDHNICYFMDFVLTIINPTVLLNTVVNDSNVVIDDEMKTYCNKSTIEDIIRTVAVEQYNTLKILNANEINFQQRGSGYNFNVHFGDAEIQEAFLNSVRNIAEVI